MRISNRCTAAVWTAVLLLTGATLAGQTPAPSGDAEKGKQLFMTIGCQACHGRTAQGVAGNRKLAPKPIPLAAGIAYVRHPRGQMIAYRPKILSDAELADIWAYLRTIPDNPPADSTVLKNW
jgi:mono/diheme cytochrome c family protein